MFCNPPYGREIGKWVHKAYIEAQKGVTVVMLIPARTDTAYFHDFIKDCAEIRFIRGRLKFTDEDGNSSDSAPFPSMVVIYNKGSDRLASCSSYCSLGTKWKGAGLAARLPVQIYCNRSDNK